MNNIITVDGKTAEDVKKMFLDERIQAFHEYFDAVREENVRGMPWPIDRFELAKKAEELNLPIPYYNDADEFVVDWAGF